MQKFLFLGLVMAMPVLAQNSLDFPKGYRGWTHVKTMVIEEGHPLFESFGGMHHLYANRQAVEGYKSGGEFPNGSVIVFDLLATTVEDHAVAEGQRKVLGVMEKHSQRFAQTGGWGFEAFAQGDASSPIVGASAADACFGCHLSREGSDYVFSSWRD